MSNFSCVRRSVAVFNRFALEGRHLGDVDLIDDALVEAVAHDKSLGGAGDVANTQVDADQRGALSDDGRGVEAAEAVVALTALPHLRGEQGTLGGLLHHQLSNALDGGEIGSGQVDGDLIPHPLMRGGEVEVLAANGEAVEEGDGASGWMT